MQPFHCDLQPQIQKTNRTMHTGTTTRCRTQRNTFATETTAAATAAHEVPFIAGCNNFKRKNTMVSCSGFLPKTKPIEHSCSHYKAFCSITWLTRISLRTRQHQITMIMQPFHCDLQPQIQKKQRTTHTGTTTRCRTQRNTFATETTAAATAAHTRYLSSPAATTLHGKYRVSSSGFPPKTKPSEHSCSQYNAFCSITWLTRISPRTWQHQMTTIMQPFHCPSSPLPSVTTSQSHHFPSSPLPIVTTSHLHHFPSSPLPLVTTSQSHHTPFVTTSQSHHTPFVTTSLRHHFP